ncbi:MAG: peptidoglycan DD-metalloendopeptidase family protein [Acidobacteriota bacterium]|nr:peptidoglycan DD-metalloendopeptidase family protein [Acidobacteriota bacterium]
MKIIYSAAFILLVLLVTTVLTQTPASPIQKIKEQGQVTVTVNPERVCYDDRRISYLNFDIIIRNGTDKEINVRELRARVLNQKGELIERRGVWAQAVSLISPNRIIAAGGEGMIYNPLIFSSVKHGNRIEYEIDFEPKEVTTALISVTPESCVTHTRLILPLQGRVAVTDGYDLLSHHRRTNFYINPRPRQQGIIDNPQRFGIDFAIIDNKGRQFTGEGLRNEDFFGWGQPVRAPGAGIVVAFHNDQPDNNVVGTENLWTNRSLDTAPGNYVLIDHGGGEFSQLSHLRAGSVRVKVGDKVKAGDTIAQLGNSGSSLGPHLHYELRSGPGSKGVRNMPPYFHDVKLFGSDESGKNNGLAVNTGDVIIAR